MKLEWKPPKRENGEEDGFLEAKLMQKYEIDLREDDWLEKVLQRAKTANK